MWEYQFDKDIKSTIKTQDIHSDHVLPTFIWFDTSDLLKFGEWIKERYDAGLWFFNLENPNLFWELIRRYFTKEWKPKKSFASMVRKQIESSSWIFYEIWLEKTRLDESIKSIQGPIGYKILEAAHNFYKINKRWTHVIRLWKERKWAKVISDNWWLTEEVFKVFLPESDWKVYVTWLKSELWRIQLTHALNQLNSWHSVIWATITKKEGEPSYFSIKWFKMARNHAYSIKSYDEASWRIEVVNPWDTSKSKFFSKDEFCDIFDKITIALSKYLISSMPLPVPHTPHQ